MFCWLCNPAQWIGSETDTTAMKGKELKFIFKLKCLRPCQITIMDIVVLFIDTAQCKGSKMYWKNENNLNDLLNIIGCKSFAINNCLKSAGH